MRILRGLGGAVLWLLAAVVGLVAVILCVTVILLPLGIPLLGLARRMVTNGVRLMLPRPVAHPVQTLDKGGRDAAKKAGRTAKRGRTPLRRRRRLLG